LEIKSETGSLSREQKAFREEWEKAGGEYEVVKSVDQGRDTLARWNVTRA
jgi:hypothetical protein